MELKVTLLAATAVGFACAAQAEDLTIATVNNGDMIRMQKLAEDFSAKHPDINVEWVTLEENILRERVTTDIATKGGQYDVLTIGTYEVPIWAKQEWLVPLEGMPEDYAADDLLLLIGRRRRPFVVRLRRRITVAASDSTSRPKQHEQIFFHSDFLILYRTAHRRT